MQPKLAGFPLYCEVEQKLRDTVDIRHQPNPLPALHSIIKGAQKEVALFFQIFCSF